MYPQLKLDNQLCFRFYTVSRLITQVYQPLLKSLGLTYPQYLVMLVLWEKDKQPVNDIAKRLMLNTNTITPLLKRLEAEGIVKRKKGSEDARQVIVSLTAKGMAMEAQAVNIPSELSKSFTCNDITTGSGTEIASLLDLMIGTLNENHPHAKGDN
ncbi:MAG: MarR family transcriptional regulator [Bacteroidales bacterium]|nr:MarR family transcriptional regulator [Bacteroidales bacterium]